MSNWLSNFIRPKINPFGNNVKDIPDNLWDKCPACDGMLFHRELSAAQYVCYHCDHHLRIDVEDRLTNLFDNGDYQRHAIPKVPTDPLKFKDKKKYSDRLSDAQKKRNRKDAIVVAEGKINGVAAMIAAFDFKFMGGSMGAGVGEGIVVAAQKAVKMVKEAGLPYIVLLTDPTTGGVSASFAMLGDIHIAEPGAMIGFAGKRVIQETIREELPDDFQTAEYLLEHGMVDMVCARKDQPEMLSRIIDMLMNKKSKPTKGVKKSGLKGIDDKIATSVPLPDVARGGNKARLTAKSKAA